MCNPGDLVMIPCEAKPGPFSDERLISIDTLDGPVTGFAADDQLVRNDENQWCVLAQVLQLKGDVVEVMVRGSFFTTNGLAIIKREVALAA